MVDMNPGSTKRKWILKRTPQQVPLAKIKGREDNLMYKLNEGYNLDKTEDRTYFEKHKIMDIIKASRNEVNYSSLIARGK